MSRWAVVLGPVALAFLLTACSGSGYHYVANKGDHTYFKVPEQWKLYDGHAVVGQLSSLSAQDKQQLLATSWFTGFDASPKPSAGHVISLGTSYPSGRAEVQQLGPESADTMSLQTLRNIVYDVDGASSSTGSSSGGGGSSSGGSSSGGSSSGTAASAATTNLLQYQQITRPGGFHGIHMVVQITAGPDSTTLNQIALLNPATTKVYVLYVSCSSTCYDKYQSKIEQVIDSWTVKDS
jgi:hypothetical protein